MAKNKAQKELIEGPFATSVITFMLVLFGVAILLDSLTVAGISLLVAALTAGFMAWKYPGGSDE